MAMVCQRSCNRRPRRCWSGSTNSTVAWVGLDRFPAIPLPLDQEPVLLELGLPPAVLRDCLRAGSAANDRLGIPISAAVSANTGPNAVQTERAGAATRGAVHHLTLPLRFEGSPGD